MRMSAKAITDTAGGRLPGVDGLRAGILGVLFVHYNRIVVPDGIAERVYHLAVQYSVMALDLFFVLSGLLITGILLDTKGSASYFRTFYIRRFLRVFPLYYAFLLMWFVVLPAVGQLNTGGAGNPPSLMTSYWTYWFNIWMTIHGDSNIPWNTIHLWSLSVEEQFYLLWPLVVYLLSDRRFRTLCLLCIIAGPLVRLGYVLNHERLGALMMLPSRMDSFAAGGLIAALLRQGQLERYRRAAWVGVAVALAVELPLNLWVGRVATMDPRILVVGGVCATLLASSLVVLSVTGGLGRAGDAVVCSRPVVGIGIVSYGIYVVHDPIEVFLDQHGVRYEMIAAWTGGPRLLPQLVWTALLTMTSIAVARISWRVLEEPVLRLKRHFRYEAGRAPSVGAPPPAAAPGPA